MQIGNMTVEINRNGKQAKLYTLAGPYRLVTDLTFEDLECLAHYIDTERTAWRRERHHSAFDPYAVLGVDRRASADEIHFAYRTLAKRHHPDATGNGGAVMALLNNAYAILGNTDRRQRYDTTTITT